MVYIIISFGVVLYICKLCYNEGYEKGISQGYENGLHGKGDATQQ